MLVWSLVICVLFLVILLGALLFVTISRYKKTGGQDWDFPEGIQYIIGTSSPLVPQNVLFAYRVIWCLFVVGVHFWTVAVDEGTGYVFFTVWNFFLLGTYFVLALYFHIRNHFQPDFGRQMDKSGRLGFVGNLFVVMFHTLATEVFLVDIIFWTLLFTGDADFSDIVQHAVNFPIFMTEFFLNRLVISWNVMAFMLFWPVTYGFWAIFYHGVGGAWVYDFVDTDYSDAIGWYIGIFLFHILLFSVVYGLSLIKKAYILKPLSKTTESVPV